MECVVRIDLPISKCGMVHSKNTSERSIVYTFFNTMLPKCYNSLQLVGQLYSLKKTPDLLMEEKTNSWSRLPNESARQALWLCNGARVIGICRYSRRKPELYARADGPGWNQVAGDMYRDKPPDRLIESSPSWVSIECKKMALFRHSPDMVLCVFFTFLTLLDRPLLSLYIRG